MELFCDDCDIFSTIFDHLIDQKYINLYHFIDQKYINLKNI
jgi:hypothetical protein